jgi:hypothetical protein
VSAATAWADLQRALTTTTPLCEGDDRFTDDGRDDANNADLRPICAECPVLVECAAYARSAPRHTLTGYWGGRRRGTRLS